MFIYREEEYKPTDENRGIAEIIIGKQRNGPTGIAQARLHQGVHALREPRVARRGRLTKARVFFACQACGFESSKWLGPLPRLRRVEQLRRGAPGSPAGPRQGPPRPAARRRGRVAPQALGRDRREPRRARIASGIGEFDRVLGGGIVPGSMVLIGGEPGIGKSTLLLQVAHLLGRSHGNVLYVSGEESERQVKLRGERLGIEGGGLYVMAETSLERILRGGREPEAAGAGGRLGADRVLGALPLGARQHQPGARGGDAAAVRRQEPRHHHVPDRPRHQGRQPGGAEVARAHRRHGALLRGREAAAPPHRARGQEPLRRGLGAGRLRDDRDRPAAGRQPLGAVPGRAAGPARPARRWSPPSRARGRCWSRCRRSSRRPRSARRAACRSASTRTGPTCCWPCSRSASGWSSWATTSS